MPAIGDGLPPRERRWAVAVIAVGTTMAVLDGSIANVALPTISRELHASPAVSIWVVNGFQIAVAVTLLTFASLGDLAGYRAVYGGGIAVFTVGSLLCALSGGLPELVAFRVLQGFGAAALMSVGPALYRTIFPTAQLGRGLGISALVVASSLSAGPTIGGLILAVAPWPWLFAINVPLGIIDTIMAVRILPHQQTVGGRFDVPSAVYSALAIGLLVVGLDGFAHRGTPLEIGVSLGLSVAAAIAFILRQRTAAHPMLPLAIFRIRRFSLAAATSLCSFVAQGLAFVSLPFLLPGPARLLTVCVRLTDHAVAGEHCICCSHCRTARGPLPAEHPVHCGLSAQRCRAGVARAFAPAPDERRHRLARGRVRTWVWFLPIAEQP